MEKSNKLEWLLPLSVVLACTGISESFCSIRNSCPVVRTTSGQVIGSTEVSRGGFKYFSFRSIPYAEPPIGNLRFSNPKPVASWSGVKNVTDDAPACTQYRILTVEQLDPDKYIGQEDCLYLSVFTRQARRTRRRPVMVYIHGGGFESLTGAAYHGPQYFMDKDMVVVIINYRLGPFGFLSMEDDVIPGNYGLKDQLLSLNWVKHNIEYFGGDPDKVTIFGESAGAASVHYHMKSRQSAGLFRRAIMSSGSVYNPWAMSMPGIARSRAVKSARILGCPYDDSNSYLTCLRGLETSQIIKLRSHFIEWDTDPFVLFNPVLERNGFWTERDLKRRTKVPLLQGYNVQEGALKVAVLLQRDLNYSVQLMSDFNTWAPLTLGYGNKGDHPDLSQTILRTYFADNSVSSVGTSEFNVNLTRLYSDSWFVSGILRCLNEHDGTVYRYRLDRAPAVTSVDIVGAKYPNGVDVKATHSDDIGFLFDSFRTVGVKLLNREDEIISNIMINLWTNFIFTGSHGGIWSTDGFLQITSDGEIKMSNDRNTEEMVYTFWNEIYKTARDRIPQKG